MLDFTFFGIIVFVILFLKNIIVLIKNKGKISDFLIKTTFIIYVLVVIKIVFFPIPFQKELLEILRVENLENISNFIPFKSIFEILKTGTWYNIKLQIGGNLILLLPLGIYLPFLFNKKNSLKRDLVFGLIIAIDIEFIQGLIGFFIGYNYRVVDIDDVILNFIGYTVGYLLSKYVLYPIYKKIFTKNPRLS
ncbi:MAG: VanZ family protein [Miniphocaeibacter sp.]|uniref:VanZ family protein n=1 Tax=Miniphocaeibacter sp. TaxID=3100973 RepID=UPI0017EBCBE5|nr:teicoplanin resistance protein VanZ [Gallicola sp.]